MEEKIIEALNQGVTHLRDIAIHTGISKKKAKEVLDELVEQQVVYQQSKEIYGLLKSGFIEIKNAGYGFISVEGEEKDYYAEPEEVNGLFDQDKVLFYPYDDGSRLLNAHILRVLERGHHFIIGKYKKRIRKGKIKDYIESTSVNFKARAIVKKGPTDIADGMIVYASIQYVGTAIEATILEVLGHPDDPGIEISQIALEYGFHLNFPEEVAQELTTIKTEVSKEECLDRRDFRSELIFTIDGDDSKDFDDAISLLKNEDGSYQLGVYIADVTHYVSEQSALDQEAYKRGTSVYLADRVIPMLPHKLSNGICSLNEGVDRLVLACLMKISSTGNLLDYEITEGVICSKHRMTYAKVNLLLEGDKATCEAYPDLVEPLQLMKELSAIIRKRRIKKGGLEFNVPEYKFRLNQDGSPSEIVPVQKELAENLIEDFMLMANETIAYHLSIMNLPGVYRIHEKPDIEKLQLTFAQLAALGVPMTAFKKEISAKQIQGILQQLKQTEIEQIGHHLLLRSMKKAKYDAACLGHYGLAMNYYCHFTSPIRRYPDLMVHRILKRLCLHPTHYEEDRIHFESLVGMTALANSKSERDSVDCERAVNDMLAAWYMEQFIGTAYIGKITSLTSTGIYVTIQNGIEGFVSLTSMQGYFEYDESTMSYYNRVKRYSLGQNVEIVVTGSDRRSRRIDFMMKCDYEEAHL